MYHHLTGSSAVIATSTKAMPTPPSKLFTLEGKGLKLDSAADIESHVAKLREMTDVVEVRLLGNTLGVEACKALGDILKSKKSLEIANLADIFTARLLNEIPPALSHLLTSLLTLPNLHTIDLSDNAFGLNTVSPLTNFLSAHTPLKHLILQNNGLGPHAGILIADSLSTLHAKKEEARKDGKTVPDLHTFICGRNRLENGSMAAFAKAFGLHTGLKEVGMVQNGIQPDGISHLLSQGFTIKGARELAKVVGGWVELKDLGVGDCLVGNRGSILVAKELQKGKNEHLETLRLQFDDVTIKGVEEYLEAAKKGLPRLRRVELNGNKFEEEDLVITHLRELLDERKDKFAESGDVVMEDEWGLDELDDLEELDSDDEASGDDEDDEDVAEEEVRAKIIKDEEEAQEEPVVQVQDKDVDKLARELETKATI